MSEWKAHWINSRLDAAEEMVSILEDLAIETVQNEAPGERGKTEKNLTEPQ